MVAEDGTILAGNHTYKAAKALGWDSLSVVRLPIESDSDEAVRIVLATTGRRTSVAMTTTNCWDCSGRWRTTAGWPVRGRTTRRWRT